jgi:hypothetical protein
VHSDQNAPSILLLPTWPIADAGAAMIAELL